MSAGGALAAITTIYGVVNKVKENKEELLRVSHRIEHIILSVEESKRRNIIREDEYNDALTTISDLILRTQRIAQRLLKRSLGDRTWNALEISSEIRRLNDDLQNYLSVHTIRTLDIVQTSNTEQHAALANNVKEIMIKLAEIDLRLGTRPGDPWAGNIQARAQNNISRPRSESLRVHFTGTVRKNTSADLAALQALVGSGKTSLRISGLRASRSLPAVPLVTFPNMKVNASYRDVVKAIGDAGYRVPDTLFEQDRLPITVTADHSCYDATASGGLQIARSEPLLWWWNKYQAYHGLAHAKTPSQTIVEVDSEGKGVQLGGLNVRFHRTLRVPDSTKNHNLPPSFGTFPMIPVSNYKQHLPEHVRLRGGFLMPMFEREALWISFDTENKMKAAIKISVGGVNAISGLAKDVMTPPDTNQDYVVAGVQPWIDGVATEPGVVRQFVATLLGKGYTVEEQVTGKAEVGGFQFDVFLRRQTLDGYFYSESKGLGTTLDDLKTPMELSLGKGAAIYLCRSMDSCTTYNAKWHVAYGQRAMTDGGMKSIADYCETYKDQWTLAGYKRRAGDSSGLSAVYGTNTSRLSYPAGRSQHRHRSHSRPPTAAWNGSSYGVALGGKINQKIYRDEDSHRMYDEENGYRFYVHIVSPEAWEAVTGILPPVTPITRDLYARHNIPWFSLYDNYVDHLLTVSNTLEKVKPVAQLDKRKQARLPSLGLVNPDDPPHCPRHLGTISSCVFRPCGHLACEMCLGKALLGGSKCTECGAPIAKFIGMKSPIPVVAKTSEEGPEWNVEELEDLAASATDSNRVSVIYFRGDRVSRLHSGPRKSGFWKRSC